MKTKFLKIAIATATFFLSTETFAGAALPKDMILKKLSGGSISAADLKGKPAVIEFWASWCASCGESMQTLQGWTKKQSGFRFLAVSVDNTMEEAKDFFVNAKSPGVKAVEKNAVFDDEAKLATAIKAPSLPTTIVVDKAGNIVLMLSGKVDSAKIKKIEEALKKS